ncbi:MAG: exodeoxyribonuclease VII large subunit [Acidobacteria bacterium]|nr:exodeoxyribonuclease VII large subunit [Acidobacteriota bacterium]
MPQPLLKSLFDDEERRPLTVSELNAEVRGVLERRFASVWLEGEIVNFSAANWGHWYFTLDDDSSQIKAACFRGTNYRIRFRPFDGLQVRVRGRVSVYEPKGEYQLIVDSLEPVGEGALLVAFEQIRAKLAKEGLFDQKLKRKLPFLPRRVGVVTSPNGAAFHDIFNVLTRRASSVSIVLIPARVQGEFAAEEIRKGIELANRLNRNGDEKSRIDVLIVGRGGGSREDLWAFNEEHLARAIRASEIPVISAVGHEIDETIADYVADYRAPTPSAAAEIVAASEVQIAGFIEDRSRALARAVERRLIQARAAFQRLELAPVFGEFPRHLREQRRGVEAIGVSLRESLLKLLRESQIRLESARSRLSPIRLAARTGDQKTRLAVLKTRHAAAMTKLMEWRAKELNVKSASLDALSPLKVLGRGYSIARNGSGKIVTSVDQVSADENVQIRLANGTILSRVVSTEKN